jgi:hypothetical protein
MNATVENYLKRNTLTARWPLQGSLCAHDISCVVVIPALAEHSLLFDTLYALTAAHPQMLEQTQVIVVINNRADATPEDIADNAATLRALELCVPCPSPSPALAWVDASTPGRELPLKEGVGLARRIGADHGLHLLNEKGKLDSPIVHLDADSPPAPGYLDALCRFYSAAPRWGGYASYQHPTDETNTHEGRSMVAYENYMRYHELGLRYAGSPYAYPALGSIMSSTAQAYASIGGMNRRCAAEDFYFMQQLSKTGTFEGIPDALVYPAGRGSHRTPFGTGRTIASSRLDATPHALLFHPQCYDILRQWLAFASGNIMASGAAILEGAAAIHPALKAFLKQLHFKIAWEKISANHPAAEGRLRQFHVWFDGLRTIQLIHHLRDTVMPNIAAGEAIVTVGVWHGATIDPNAAPLVHLREMRRLCRLNLRRSP